MMKTGMLVISNPSIVYRTLPFIQSEISNTLYVQYFPSSKWNNSLTSKSVDNTLSLKKPMNWPTYSSSVIGLYSKMLPYKHLDVRLILSGIRNQTLSQVITHNPVEIVYYDQLFSQDEVNKFVCSCVQNKTSHCQVVPLPNQNEEVREETEESINKTIDGQMYDNVVLGGTFDRLHYGHKILLSEAILRCHKKITIGVTDTIMLKSKKLWELVEPCDLRIQKVREFVEEIEPSLEYDIVPISDVFGPTKDDPTFQMIVVSSETIGGGSKINEIRTASGLNPLSIHTVDLLPDVNKEEEEEEEKISSSNLRMRSLGSLRRAPQPNPNIAEKPYIIGLTGGIASGKTNIAKHLETLGAGVVDCDQIGHHIYRVGSPGHAKVVECFGEGVLDDSGAIDRRKLGAIVFSDKDKLQMLNLMLWPLILEEAQALAQQLYTQGHQVVVLEAAVLIRAHWAQFCHEMWVSIIPPEEAVKRVVQRNGLSEDEAKARLVSQPTNSEQVEQANVVFCSLWRHEFTRKQVSRAWTNLRERLNQNKPRL